MNVASRMESTGLVDRIQISEETAQLLEDAGKGDWFSRREKKILAKGKGELTTFWLEDDFHKKRKHSGGSLESSRVDDTASTDESSCSHWDSPFPVLSSGKVSRLVDWNVDVMSRLLKQIVAKNRVMYSPNEITAASLGWARDVSDGKTVLDEVKETILLPPFHARMVHLAEEAESIELDAIVKNQLHEFVSDVASMYHDNPFHNFEHASHVTMSVVVSLH